jgi:hypothetical protein
MTRRNFIATGLATTAPLASDPSAKAAAQAAPPTRRIIDVHHHVAPPDYLTETKARQNPPVIN